MIAPSVMKFRSIGPGVALIPTGRARKNPLSQIGFLFFGERWPGGRHRFGFDHPEQERVSVTGDDSFRCYEARAVKHKDIFSGDAVCAVALEAAPREQTFRARG